MLRHLGHDVDVIDLSPRPSNHDLFDMINVPGGITTIEMERKATNPIMGRIQQRHQTIDWMTVVCTEFASAIKAQE